MKMMRVINSSVALTVLSLVSGMVLADCRLQAGSAAIIRTMPLLAGNLTVGRDVPVGASIFRQTFKSYNPVTIECDSGVYNRDEEYAFISMPLPLANYSGSPAQAGKIYESGVPGIGVGFWRAGTHMPAIWTSPNCGAGTCITTIPMDFDIELYKIGPVSPGTIQGASLPTMVHRVTSPTSLLLEQVGLSGSINIVSRTCDTPDVTVPMGSHRTSEFSGLNSATTWKNFSIALNNCPAFYGTQSGGNLNWWADGGVNNRTPNPNILRYRLDPNQTAINAGQGILSIDSSAAGQPAAATGIGVQVADAVFTPLPLATLKPSGIVAKATDGLSYTIPLSARYIQTGSSVSAGPANASAVFTINYQ